VVASLEEALRSIQNLDIQRCDMNDIQRQSTVGEGETFIVERCLYRQELVAVKRLKMGGSETDSNKLRKRLSNLLLDLRIMHHSPLRSHPNILNLVGYGWDIQGESLNPFVVVDYTSKGSGRSYLQGYRGRMPFSSKLIFIEDIAAGLSALHDCGIVHGDLKLDNVLVFHSWDRPSNAIMKICDFGHSLIPLENEDRRIWYHGTTLWVPPKSFNWGH
jgi:serine/threonine protein kinase